MADTRYTNDGKPTLPQGLVREQRVDNERLILEGDVALGTPCPEPAPPSRIKNAVAWFAAAIGTLGVYLGIQVSVPVLFGLLLAIPALTVGIGGLILMHFVASAVLVATELITIAVFFAWWRYLRPRAVLLRGERAPGARTVAVRLLAVVLLGIGAQVTISIMLTYLLPLFPAWDAEYSELMSDPLFSDLSVVSLFVVAIAAPLIEEHMCRGVMLEFITRGLCPGLRARWRKRRRGAALASLSETQENVPDAHVSLRKFWWANVIQALMFAVLHLNVVQGSYAFLIGILFGWMAYRTGKLAYNICLHLVINLSSYFIYEISLVLGICGDAGMAVSGLVLLVGGFVLFARTTK